MEPHTDDDFPPLPPLDEYPPIRTQADLERLWRALMGPLGFARRSLWIVPIDRDDRPGPAVAIDDVPLAPGADDLDFLVDMLRHGTFGEASVAFLVTVPGRRRISRGDREWARGLARVAGRAGMTDRPVHWANDAVLHVCAPDDLAA